MFLGGHYEFATYVSPYLFSFSITKFYHYLVFSKKVKLRMWLINISHVELYQKQFKWQNQSFILLAILFETPLTFPTSSASFKRIIAL